MAKLLVLEKKKIYDRKEIKKIRNKLLNDASFISHLDNGFMLDRIRRRIA